MSTKRVAIVSDHFKLYAGRELERGQVFELQNQLNDEKLLGWNYVRELEPGQETYTCKCGREFLGGVTDPPARAHGIKWQGQCSPAINVDGVQIKSGAKPRLQGGGDPDADGPGWDVGVGVTEGPPSDPYAGRRDPSGKERPKRVSLG
jgi:hypothetical protein